jgi:hypothetical protein
MIAWIEMAPMRAKKIHNDVTSHTSGQEGSGRACGLMICGFLKQDGWDIRALFAALDRSAGQGSPIT